MANNISQLRQAIEPYRSQIINHPVYQHIQSVDDVRLFMQHHVYAVWDFMSLLKYLQNSLTCTTIPWVPVGDANTRFLINEIVVGEESDVDNNGNRVSHFELYLQAMQQCGATIEPIQELVAHIKNGKALGEAMLMANTPHAAQLFMANTFDVIRDGKIHVAAAVFTFGREDLIPGMFMSIINDMNHSFPNLISTFKYYLDRHIEVDGGHHSNLALQMVEALCGNDGAKWADAEQAAIKALQMRIALWDGIHESILNKKAGITPALEV